VVALVQAATEDASQRKPLFVNLLVHEMLVLPSVELLN
jgi:hypothetical protein